MISIDEMKDIMKIVKPLEASSGFLIKEVSQAIKNETKEK